MFFMITDSDARKLVKEFKKVFATKEDIKRLEKKQDSYQQENVDNFKTILEMLQEHMEKIDGSLDELKSNRIVLGNHEQRLQKVETKVFSTT